MHFKCWSEWTLVACLGLSNAACLVREPVHREASAPTCEAQVSRRWHANGVRAKQEELLLWSDGRLERHGASRAWYDSGGLTYERFYAHDQGVQLWRSWFESGALQSAVDMADGQSLAAMRFYYESGQLAASGAGIAGSRYGPWSYWHANGQLSEQGEYDNTRKLGPWHYWDAEGQRIERTDPLDSD